MVKRSGFSFEKRARLTRSNDKVSGGKLWMNFLSDCSKSYDRRYEYSIISELEVFPRLLKLQSAKLLINTKNYHRIAKGKFIVVTHCNTTAICCVNFSRSFTSFTSMSRTWGYRLIIGFAFVNKSIENQAQQVLSKSDNGKLTYADLALTPF